MSKCEGVRIVCYDKKPLWDDIGAKPTFILFSLSMEMNRLTRVGTAEPVSRAQILRHARGQGNINFPCSADHEQDWPPYPVDSYSAICDDRTYIHTYILYTYINVIRVQQTRGTSTC